MKIIPNQNRVSAATQTAKARNRQEVQKHISTKAYYDANPAALQELVLLYNMAEVSNIAAARFINELAENHSGIFKGELKMLHTRASKAMNELLKMLYNTVKENGNKTSPITAQAKFISEVISLMVIVPAEEMASTLKTIEYVVQEKLKKKGGK